MLKEGDIIEIRENQCTVIFTDGEYICVEFENVEPKYKLNTPPKMVHCSTENFIILELISRSLTKENSMI